MTPSLGSGAAYAGVDGQGEYSNFDRFTGRGFMTFAPWSNPGYSGSLGQINLAYIPMSKADTYYSGSIVNNSREQFYYYYGWFKGTSTYLANQYHLTVNQSSAVNSVARSSFNYTIDPADSASVQSVSLRSVPDQISTKSARNRAIKSVQNPTTSTANTTINPFEFPSLNPTTPTPISTPNNSLNYALKYESSISNPTKTDIKSDSRSELFIISFTTVKKIPASDC